MKKIIVFGSILFLALFLGTALASEPPVEEAVWEEQTIPVNPEISGVENVDILTVWPFQPSDVFPGSPEPAKTQIDTVRVDLSVEHDDYNPPMPQAD